MPEHSDGRRAARKIFVTKPCREHQKMDKNVFLIPKKVVSVVKTLENKGFEAYLIGGCTRDLILGRKPKDWDVTTNATPKEIISTFPDTFYENDYGTVGVEFKDTEDETLKYVEVTPYRLEAKYSDNRHPDTVTFSKNLEEDLKRRDFTINAIAIKLQKEIEENEYETEIVDLFEGQKDLKEKIIKTVGEPEDRFNEDALRILRAIRLSAELGFEIDQKTEEAIKKLAKNLENIAKERIRDEFAKIVMSDMPWEGLKMAEEFGVLPYIMPELAKGKGVIQGGEHIYDVWEHTLRAVQHSADKKMPLEVRLAVLLHDIGKPKTARPAPEKEKWTFYGHEVVGAKIAEKALNNLKFPKKVIEKVSKLVRWHMFFSDTEQITLSAVRRLLAKVGHENIWDLINVRISDRIGMGRPKEEPYRLRKYQSMIEEVMRDPVSVGMLKIDGNGIMETLKCQPGPKIGFILNALLQEVLDNPGKNTEEYMQKRVMELDKLPEKELKKLGEEGKERKEKEEEKDIGEIRKKYYVK